MGAALQRLWYETTARFLSLSDWPLARFSRRARERNQDRCMIGEYEADYGPVSREQLSDSDPEMEAILARSTVISAKRGL